MTITMITRPVGRPLGLTHVHVYTVEPLIAQSMETVSGSHRPVEIKIVLFLRKTWSLVQSTLNMQKL